MDSSFTLAAPLAPQAFPGEAFPWACEPLEEVAAAEPADLAAALGFAIARLVMEAGADARPIAWVTTPMVLQERGRPFSPGLAARGLAHGRMLWIRAEREAEALWALEEALKSGAVAGGLAVLAAPSLTATRRLDFAARAGAAHGLVLREQPMGDLSAARRRWRIRVRPSGPAAFDPAAPGAARLSADLTRRRDGPPGAWELELDDETGALRLVAGLADHGLASPGDAVRAA